MRNAYIAGVAAFLPNSPVDNENIEKVLGVFDGGSASSRRLVLGRNGIRQRYYAIDPGTGRQTHTNAQLTAEAIRELSRRTGIGLSDIDSLVCGTSSPDQWIPHHALMVQGELALPPCEVVSTAGVCLSGMTALKYAAMSVASGSARRAVATGSELSSTVLRAAHFRARPDAGGSEARHRSRVDFGKEFLRWMLSDGAGAVLVSSELEGDSPALRIDWIEIVSFAGALPSCMYWGAVQNDDGSLVGWRELEGEPGAWRPEALDVVQDVRLLRREIGASTLTRALPPILRKRGLEPEAIDWFVPHISSELFRQELQDRLAEVGFPIPPEKWFTNLSSKGNTGSASPYVQLDELHRSGRIRDGQRLLLFVPESARFSAAYVHLTAVVHQGRDA